MIKYIVKQNNERIEFPTLETAQAVSQDVIVADSQLLAGIPGLEDADEVLQLGYCQVALEMLRQKEQTEQVQQLAAQLAAWCE